MKWTVLIFIFICIGVFIRFRFDVEEEHFTVHVGLEESIIQTYSDILQRQPSSTELVESARDIGEGKLTLEGLRQRLLDTEEYMRLIKLQSNSLTPELQKVISDKSLIQKITDIYVQERKSAIPEEMVLPLKDVYIWLNYNEFAFRAFLRNETYLAFEDDAKHASNLDKETLEQLVATKFDKKQLETTGEVIAKEIAAVTVGNVTSGNAQSTQLKGISSQDSKLRTVSDTDSDMTPMVNGIMSNANTIFNKDEVARMLDAQREEAQIPVQTHYGQMTLRPDQSWTVPQRPAPVCTTLGRKPLIQPVMTNSPLLLGTSLEDAESTDVGSIMPKFEYKEYVPIMIQKDIQSAQVTHSQNAVQ